MTTLTRHDLDHLIDSVIDAEVAKAVAQCNEEWESQKYSIGFRGFDRGGVRIAVTDEAYSELVTASFEDMIREEVESIEANFDWPFGEALVRALTSALEQVRPVTERVKAEHPNIFD